MADIGARDRAPRVLVHAGFYKTGTTSLQAFLERHRHALKPYANVHMKTDLGRARYLGRWYGQRPSRLTLWLFEHGLSAALRRIPDAPVIILSRESWSGMMPGFRRGGAVMTDGSHDAITLARAILRCLRRRFGPDVRVEFLYSLREAEAWQRSLYGHVLRSSRLTDDWLTFRKRFANTPDPAAQAARVAAALTPIPVHISPLEDASQHRLGHGATVLRLLGVPQDEWRTFTAAPPNNPGPTTAQRERMLTLNRAGGLRARLRASKEAMMEQGKGAG